MSQTRRMAWPALAVAVVVAMGLLVSAFSDPLRPFDGLPDDTELVAEDDGAASIAEAVGSPLADLELGDVETLVTAPDGRLAVSGFGWGVLTDGRSEVTMSWEPAAGTEIAPTADGGAFVVYACRVEKVAPSGESTVLLTPRELCPLDEWKGKYGESSDAPYTFRKIGPVTDVDVGVDGSLYMADAAAEQVLRLQPDGRLEAMPVKGKPAKVTVGDGGSVYVLAESPYTAAIGASDLLYRIDPDGHDSLLAGGGESAPLDTTRGVETELSMPSDVTVDGDGNVYVALNCCAYDQEFRGVMVITPRGITRPLTGSIEDGSEETDTGSSAVSDPSPLIDAIAIDRRHLYMALDGSDGEDSVAKLLRMPLQASG